jgi:site-specific DNA-methyltransferase (adenine-specific)/modification methylase
MALKKAKPFQRPQGVPQYESAESMLSFASANMGRVLPSLMVREKADVESPKTHDWFRRNGMKLLTHRECPGLLHPEQVLFWPTDESLPEIDPASPQAPAYDPHDGRRFVPSRMLRANEITNTLFEGDCLNILPFFPAASVDMVLCDLPYGTTQNKWDSLIPLEPLWEQYRRILKPNGVVVLTSQGVFTAKVILSNEAWFKYKIVWEKSKPTNFLNAKKQPLRKHEDVCVFYAHQPKYNPQMKMGEPYDKGVRKNQLSGSYGDFMPARVRSSGQRYPTDVVYFKTAESEGTVWHPTQKPVELGRYLVRTFTDPDALVLDNAFGSGSFLVAAAIEGRRYAGIERNQDVQLFKRIQIDYVGVARERIKHVTEEGWKDTTA